MSFSLENLKVIYYKVGLGNLLLYSAVTFCGIFYFIGGIILIIKMWNQETLNWIFFAFLLLNLIIVILNKNFKNINFSYKEGGINFQELPSFKDAIYTLQQQIDELKVKRNHNEVERKDGI